MAKQSEAAKLRRRKVPNRRGAWDTWGDWSWQALLVRSEGDPADALAACDQVGAVERDVTAAVLAGEWVPPAGDWALLVVPEATEWAHLVISGRADDLIEQRLADLRGETLVTGYGDTAGVVYLRHRRHADGTVEMLTDFVTDGVRWDPLDPDDGDPDDPDEDPDDEGDTRLEGARFPRADAAAWLEERTSTEDAHQTLLRDLDAYLPGLVFERDGRVGNSGRLTAAHGHDDFLSAKHVARVDVVRFGKVREASPDETAGRRLEAAVGRGDLKAVTQALADGATVGVLPDSRHTALWIACNLAAEYGAPDRAALGEIVGRLLDAGADPNARPVDAESPFEAALGAEFVQNRERIEPPDPRWLDVLALTRRLAAAGCDVNAVSRAHDSLGRRVLHVAATRNRPAVAALLIELGADPHAPDARGRTPREGVVAMLESNAQRTWAPNHVSLEDGLAEHAEVLALLDAAEASRG